MIDQFNIILNVLLIVLISFLLFLLSSVIFLLIRSNRRVQAVMEGINQSVREGIGPLLNAVGNSANALTSSSKLPQELN